MAAENTLLETICKCLMCDQLRVRRINSKERLYRITYTYM